MKNPFRGAAAAQPGHADPVVVVDVGARWGIGERWAALAPALRVYGFDPDPEECARLNAKARAEGDATTTYVPVALGSKKGTVTLHTTVEPACSSLYPPIAELAVRLPALKVIAPAGTAQVSLATLDDWCADEGVTHIDALKIDTQGSELGVLQGADKVLDTVQVLEIEVEFNPMYAGQPLFGDVDAHLRARGFELWRLDHLAHYSTGAADGSAGAHLRTFYDSVAADSRGGGGQLYWGHAYYAREELCARSDSRPTPEQARRAAAVAGCLGLPDLAALARTRATA